VVWGPGSTEEPPSAPFVKTLNEIGYHATLHKPLKTFPDYLSAITRARAQIGMVAYGDSADGADALNNMICHGYGNFGNFCNRRVTAQYYRAVGLEATDPPAGRLLLAKIDRELVNDAAVVPIWDSNWFALTSARVGNWSANLKLGPLITDLWVK
jgi:hypothetical protein